MTTRITGGEFRGRALRTMSVRGMRPTAERVRAALFSIIGEVEGLRLADLYAGTGAVGFDALSRGAGHVDFIERHPKLCRSISQRQREWSLEGRSSVYRGQVLTVLDRITTAYDIVVADPPYESNELGKLLRLLQSPNLLEEGGLVVLEHRSGRWEDFVLGRFSLETTKRYGDTALTVMRAGVFDG